MMTGGLFCSFSGLCLCLFILGKDEIEEDGEEEYYSYAVFSEDGLDDLREDGEHLSGLGKAETYAEGERSDDHVALAETATGHHAETCEKDATEHHNSATAENALGNGGEESTYGGEDTTENHDAGASGDGETIDNLRHCSKSYVLAEGGDGGTTEEAGDGADETVAGYSGTKF